MRWWLRCVRSPLLGFIWRPSPISCLICWHVKRATHETQHYPPFSARPPQIKRLRQESEERSASQATLAVKVAQAEAAEEQIRDHLAQLSACIEEVAEASPTTEVGGTLLGCLISSQAEFRTLIHLCVCPRPLKTTRISLTRKGSYCESNSSKLNSAST